MYGTKAGPGDLSLSSPLSSPLSLFSHRRLAREVARRHRVAVGLMLSNNCRLRDATRARFEYWSLLRERGWSFPRIGALTGHHHASVMNGVTQWNEVWKPRLGEKV